MKSITWLLCAAAVAAVQTTAALAQTYPARAIRMVVPFPPGGPNDILARLLAQKATEQMGQPMVLDNRGGAGGVIGTDAVARAAPDGYTLLFSGTASLSINPSLYAKLPYDPIKDFAPVTLVGTAPSIFILHPSVPVKSIRELIDHARANPGKLNFASAGIGTPPHLGGELFNTMAGVQMVHVPYKGGGPATADLLAGQVQLYISGISTAIPLVKEGKVRGIAVTSAKRTSLLPDTPTVSESGLPGFEVGNWYAIVAPANTPRPIVMRLNAEFNKAIGLADVRKRFFDLAVEPMGTTPEELAAYNKSEITKWAGAIKAAGMKADQTF